MLEKEAAIESLPLYIRGVAMQQALESEAQPVTETPTQTGPAIAEAAHPNGGSPWPSKGRGEEKCYDPGDGGGLMLSEAKQAMEGDNELAGARPDQYRKANASLAEGRVGGTVDPCRPREASTSVEDPRKV
jgi:hypothetical protein